MMSHHSLPPEALHRFLAGTSGPAERREIVRHLLRGCSICRAFFRQIVQFGSPTLAAILPAYNEAFERAQEIVARSLDHLDEPRRAFLELLGHPFPRQEMLVYHHRRYWNVGLCDLLARESHEIRFSDPVEMLRRARLAVQIAERLASTARRDEQVTASRARAWMAFGNALRVAGDLRNADRALVKAAGQLLSRDVPLLLRADLLNHLSSLRFEQRRLEEALVLTRQDIDVRRDLHAPAEVVRSLVKHALNLGEGGRPIQALAVLTEAEKAAKFVQSPRTDLIIRHNVIRFQLDSGKPELAQRLFAKAEPTYQKTKDRLIRTKGIWLKGQILAALGEMSEATDLFQNVEQDLLDRGNMLDAATVRLERAVLLLKTGRKQEVRKLALTALREFRARGVRRDDLAAYLLLRQAS